MSARRSECPHHIDERVNAFLERPIEGEWRYLWLDATYLKVREGGRIVSVAAIIAAAVNTDGREIIGLGIGPSEAEPFWTGFLKSLVKRGLKGVSWSPRMRMMAYARPHVVHSSAVILPARKKLDCGLAHLTLATRSRTHSALSLSRFRSPERPARELR